MCAQPSQRSSQPHTYATPHEGTSSEPITTSQASGRGGGNGYQVGTQASGRADPSVGLRSASSAMCAQPSQSSSLPHHTYASPSYGATSFAAGNPSQQSVGYGYQGGYQAGFAYPSAIPQPSVLQQPPVVVYEHDGSGQRATREAEAATCCAAFAALLCCLTCLVSNK